MRATQITTPASPHGLRAQLALFLGVMFVVAHGVPVSAKRAENDDTRARSKPLSRLQEYLRLDTTNPPGNEMLAVDFFARIFEREGIEYETVVTAPGRGNVWARLEGGPGKALVLLHHTDVVPARAEDWQYPPFGATLHEGVVHGRGALDTKSLGILHLETFLELARSARPLRRPVIFMATADEEAGGGLGARWMVENRPDVFRDVGFLLNEGGGGLALAKPVFSVEVTQKVPLWLRLRTKGVPGHGSTPRAHGAVRSLIRALARLESHRFEPQVVDPVRTYLRGMADLQPGLEGAFSNLDRAVRDPRFMASLQVGSPSFHALLRNTCAITVLEGSPSINVVPAQATAELDCRLLPGVDADHFEEELRRILAEPTLEIERRMAFEPAASPVDTPLFAAIEEVCLRYFPDGRVLPSVVSGFTDSHVFRRMGIVSYGFRPSMMNPGDAAGVHGHDERIEVGDFELGLVMMQEIVERFVF